MLTKIDTRETIGRVRDYRLAEFVKHKDNRVISQNLWAFVVRRTGLVTKYSLILQSAELDICQPEQ